MDDKNGKQEESGVIKPKNRGRVNSAGFASAAARCAKV